MTGLHTLGVRPKPGERSGYHFHNLDLSAKYLWDGAWRRVRLTQAWPHSMGGVIFGDLAEQAWRSRLAVPDHTSSE